MVKQKGNNMRNNGFIENNVLTFLLGILFLFSCEPETYLFIEETSFAFEEIGGSYELQVLANKSWQASTDVSWCHINPSAGSGSNSGTRAYVQCDANETLDDRFCTLTVQCADVVKRITITQSAKGAIIIEKLNYDLSYEEQTLSVAILENTEYKVQVNVDCQDWIQLVEIKGLNTSSFTLQIAENERGSREGTVYVTSSSDIIALKIKQEDGTVTIPDLYFRSYCLDNFDSNRDGLLSYKEVKAVTSINVNSDNIKTLAGIEYFINITRLYCTGQSGKGSLGSLDVSNNVSLTELYCYNNVLTDLDVSKNVELESLCCDNNQLTSLDVSKNNDLEDLSCAHNQLTSLDVSKNVALERLNCSFNQLTSLEVSKNEALTYLEVSYNQLTSLDASKNVALERLNCGFNQLTSLDVSNNKALTYLYCGDNQLTSLDVSKNEALTDLICDYNQLTSLDVSKNEALKFLVCYNITMTDLYLAVGQEFEYCYWYEGTIVHYK